MVEDGPWAADTLSEGSKVEREGWKGGEESIVAAMRGNEGCRG